MEKVIFHHSYNTRESSKNRKNSYAKEQIVTSKSWKNSVGPVLDTTLDKDNGDHPLWRKASLEEKMNLVIECSEEKNDSAS
tara:strand:+ start:274 stop:516 length:243 start_codon:yes stop_codon:yes gene_type:complete